jgi:hypothetical protein
MGILHPRNIHTVIVPIILGRDLAVPDGLIGVTWPSIAIRLGIARPSGSSNQSGRVLSQSGTVAIRSLGRPVPCERVTTAGRGDSPREVNADVGCADAIRYDAILTRRDPTVVSTAPRAERATLGHGVIVTGAGW